MSCTGCFGGCADITPDKCIRYTGVTISELGISNGDTLQSVISNVTDYLLGALDGSGINISIDSGYLCDRITSYLGAATSLDAIIIAITRTVCSIVEEVETNTDNIAELSTGYTTSCLTGVDNTSDIKEVVQAIITKLCALDTTLTELLSDLPLTYVLNEDFDSKVQAYLDAESIGSLVREKMVPYVAYPYFGSLDYFNNGVGTNDWVSIYLCNGQNGTPDLRGRTIVSVTNVSGGLSLNKQVDPVNGNPNYTLNTPIGDNYVSLSSANLPIHTHANTIELTEPNGGHNHLNYVDSIPTADGDLSANTITSANSATKGASGGYYSYYTQGSASAPTLGKTSLTSTGITVEITNASVGEGESHSNIQPVLPANFIMYIPSV